MIIRTGCIFAPRDTYPPHKGIEPYRICIMGRLTLADGKTPDKRLTEPGAFDLHWAALAPHPKDVGTWHKSRKTEEDWQKFANEYLYYLRRPGVNEEVLKLIEMAIHRPIILLCAEETPEHCHRRLLANRCREIRPDLRIGLDIR